MSYYSHSTFVGMSAGAPPTPRSSTMTNPRRSGSPPDPLAGMPSSGWSAGRTVTVQPAAPASTSYPPTIEQFKAQFLAKYPDYVFQNSRGGGLGGYKVVQFPTKPAVAGEVPHCANRASGLGAHFCGEQRQCGCALWSQFLQISINEFASEAGRLGAFCSYYECNACPLFKRLAGMIEAYDKLLKQFPAAFTMPARLERERQRELLRQREEERKQAAERQHLAAAEKARQETENKNKAAAQHVLEMAQAKDWAAKKIQEEKAAAERLAAERELAELFAPQPISPASAPTSVYRAQDWMTKAQFRAMRQRAGFPLNADQHVCHIIAESNGGADHIDNYYVAAGSLNQSLGNRNDAYLAEAAGLEQTSKAVAVSRTTGYTGPGAEELIAMAKAMRTGANTQSRNAPVALPTPTVETVDPAITFSKFMGKVSSIMMGPCPHFARGERGCMIGLLPVERQRAYAELWGETRLEEVPKSLIKEMRAEVEQRLCPSQSVKDALESQRRAAAEQYESTTFTREERILRGTW